ncbi:unnamed protein product [Clonostachys rhizophaga]|uniref:Gfo/Idh/MocA-like oxidoreductase N-terminal domain-containing protein n=1 Tax=Clonostachys rhizophaga TaxID=160324 RepID=A0A9N9V651_9HYPO|nr:unnamed protein product [Clonostachys rhizophaga]
MPIRQDSSVHALGLCVTAFREAHVYDSIEDTTPGAFVWLCTAATAIGGSLFGYDTGVISGVLVVLGTDLDNKALNDTDKELITTLAAAGAFCGAIVAGVTADKYGITKERAGSYPLASFAQGLFINGYRRCLWGDWTGAFALRSRITRCRTRGIDVSENGTTLIYKLDSGTSDGHPNTVNVAKEHNVPFFESVEGFLGARAMGKVLADGIILATPTPTHAPLTTALVGSGLAVLIEKPVAVDGVEGRALLKACAADKNGIYMVGHHRRHSSAAATMKKAIDSGKLVWAARKPDAYFEIPWRRSAGSGGVILTNIIHEVDLLQYWLGDTVEIYAMEGIRERPYPIESTV